MRSFSTKYAARGILYTCQCLVMMMMMIIIIIIVVVVIIITSKDSSSHPEICQSMNQRNKAEMEKCSSG